MLAVGGAASLHADMVGLLTVATPDAVFTVMFTLIVAVSA
jgi:hypothetical protein